MFLLLLFSFGALLWAFYTNDFTLNYVATNSNSQLPWYYRLTAVWGAHEGSLLLWVLIQAAWTIAVATFSRGMPQESVARVLAVMGMISVGFLLFIIVTSNPFLRTLPFFPVDGRDLNPLLQDPGLIIHPPMLYMGYVGFSVAFSFAIASLMTGRLDTAWARWSRPWTTAAWLFLTLGYRTRLLVGVLRTRLGRLVVLGPSRKRVIYALASGYRADALTRGNGKTRYV